MISWPGEWLVEHRKIVDYLLNIDHHDGRAKARALMSAGFDPAEPDMLALALLEHARTVPHREIPGHHGIRIVFEGPLAGPKTIIERFRSVWLVDTDVRVARLVTAYPFDKQSGGGNTRELF